MHLVVEKSLVGIPTLILHAVHSLKQICERHRGDLRVPTVLARVIHCVVSREISLVVPSLLYRPCWFLKTNL